MAWEASAATEPSTGNTDDDDEEDADDDDDANNDDGWVVDDKDCDTCEGDVKLPNKREG